MGINQYGTPVACKNHVAGVTDAPTSNISDWFDEHDAPCHLALAYLRLFDAEGALHFVTGNVNGIVASIAALREEVWSRLYDRTSQSERDAAFVWARNMVVDRARAKVENADAVKNAHTP